MQFFPQCILYIFLRLHRKWSIWHFRFGLRGFVILHCIFRHFEENMFKVGLNISDDLASLCIVASAGTDSLHSFNKINQKCSTIPSYFTAPKEDDFECEFCRRCYVQCIFISERITRYYAQICSKTRYQWCKDRKLIYPQQNQKDAIWHRKSGKHLVIATAWY